MDGSRRVRCHIDTKCPDIEVPHQLLFWSSKCTPGRRPEAKEQAKYGEARAQSNPRWSQSSAYNPQSRVAPESAHGAVFKFEIVQKGGADGATSAVRRGGRGAE
jgi:hypothetical protein